MEQPASFLRVPRFTLMLVRTGDAHRVPPRELEEREVHRRVG